MTGYDQTAFDAIQQLFDDSARSALADRVDEVLTRLDAGGDDPRLHRHRMRHPQVWAVFVSESGEDWALLWEPDATGEPHVHYAGPSWL